MKTFTGSPVDRLLTLGLILSPAITLISSVLYAARGWDDADAALFHIVGGLIGALLVLRLVTYLNAVPRLAAVALAVGMIGSGGVVAYGFNTIEVSLGVVDLVDRTGAAFILKPLGLCWPFALLLLGIGLLRAGRVPSGVGIGILVAAVLFPVSRIANIAWLAIIVDTLLLLCLAAIPVVLRPDRHDSLYDGDPEAGQSGSQVSGPARINV